MMRSWIIFVFAGSCAMASNYKMPLYMNTSYSQNSGVLDHRTYELAEIPTSSENEFSISQILFNFGIHTARGTDYASQIEFDLPLRSVKTSGAFSEFSGSEFGGFGIKWKQIFLSSIATEIGYSKQSSPTLNLFSPSQNFDLKAKYIVKTFATPSLLLQAVMGPGIRFTQSSVQGSNFGPMYSAVAGVESTFQSVMGKLSFGIHASFAQRSSFTQNSTSVMATLFNLRPQLAWEIIDDLWVSAHYNTPLVRPIGFEQAMGDSSLPGLYGNNFGIGLTTASF